MQDMKSITDFISMFLYVMIDDFKSFYASNLNFLIPLSLQLDVA